MEKEKVYKVWDNYRVIDAVQKNDTTKTLVFVGCRYGVRYIGIRDFYHKKSTDEWLPSTGGFVIPLKIPVERGTKILTPFNALLGALLKAVEELNNMPIEDENNQVYKVRRYDNAEN